MEAGSRPTNDFDTEWDVPLPVRQMAREYDTFMPGPSWADLAEDDLEMRLMGPPTHIPTFVDPGWVTPRRSVKRPPPPPTTYLETSNRFELLEEGRITPPTPRRVASLPYSRPPSASASQQESDHRSGPLTECTRSASEAPHPPMPSPRTD